MHCFEETGSHRRSREMTRSEECEKVDCTAHRHKRMSTERAMQPRRAACNWIRYSLRGGGRLQIYSSQERLWDFF